MPLHTPKPAATTFTVLLGAVVLAAGGLGRAESVTPTTCRSRQVDLYYRVTGAPDAAVELWYTRDRGVTWQSWGKDDDRVSPLSFAAPSEGMFGFTLIAHVGGQPSRPAPVAFEPPQRWVFVDATPPLAQWNGVEPAEGFAVNRTLQLRWTAHDDNLAARPVGLSYQSSIDQVWHEIDNSVANAGSYDWKVPATVAGQITVKLIVRDEGGHAVERLFGPVCLDKYLQTAGVHSLTGQAEAKSATVTQPAETSILAASTQPALPRVDLLKQRVAADLYRQATWHMSRGQYAVAAERLHESLEQDPDLLDARNDLAGIFYRQQDYDRAIAEYQTVLTKKPDHESALYNAAWSYASKRDYEQARTMLTRLLAVNDHNANAWLDLGDVLFMMNDATNARGNWRRATKVDPSAKEVVEKAQRRLDQYGADQVSSTR